MLTVNNMVLVIASVVAAYFVYKMITHSERFSPKTLDGKHMVAMQEDEQYLNLPNNYVPKTSPAGIVEYAGNAHNLGAPSETRIDVSSVCGQPCNQIGVASSLLPKSNRDDNACWDDFSLKNQSFLDPSKLIGVNTVGGSRRNPNLQLQGEPVIPKKNLCPWNNSSIAPALCKKTLEIDNNPEPGAPVEKMASGSPPLSSAKKPPSAKTNSSSV